MPNDDITHPIPDLTGYITEGQVYVDRQLHNRWGPGAGGQAATAPWGRRRVRDEPGLLLPTLHHTLLSAPWPPRPSYYRCLQAGVPPHQRAAQPVAADEERHRRGHDARRPFRGVQPALCQLRHWQGRAGRGRGGKGGCCPAACWPLRSTAAEGQEQVCCPAYAPLTLVPPPPCTQGMKAVVGEEALSPEDLLYLQFLDKFESRFVNQGLYDNRTIFDSLDLAWSLLRLFPRELLRRITTATLDKYYDREKAAP